jgi:hypothetical protein
MRRLPLAAAVAIYPLFIRFTVAELNSSLWIARRTNFAFASWLNVLSGNVAKLAPASAVTSQPVICAINSIPHRPSRLECWLRCL